MMPIYPNQIIPLDVGDRERLRNLILWRLSNHWYTWNGREKEEESDQTNL